MTAVTMAIAVATFDVLNHFTMAVSVAMPVTVSLVDNWLLNVSD